MATRDPAPTAVGETGLLDAYGAAARLGVSHHYIRKLVEWREIPYIKVGRLLRFDPKDLDRWVDDRRRGAGE